MIIHSLFDFVQISFQVMVKRRYSEGDGEEKVIVKVMVRRRL